MRDMLHMLRPTAVKVKPENDYTLIVDFDNGEKRRFNVMPYIRGEWYGQLSEKTYFMSVQADGYTVAWPDGQDICPDDLYYLSVPAE